MLLIGTAHGAMLLPRINSKGRVVLKTIGKVALYTIGAGFLALYVVATFMDASACRSKGGGYVDGLCLRPELLVK